MTDQSIAIQPLAESALLVSLGNEIDLATVNRVMALAAAIDRESLTGVTDVVSSYTTIMVVVDPTVTDYDDLTEALRRLARDTTGESLPPSRNVTIPVLYGGEVGPDLGDVADHTGLPADEVVARHAAAEYVVACMGFAPGFGFLIGLPSELGIPRRQNPRTRVPAGSVAIGGVQTGIYSLDTPGGWHVIGKTPLVLFDYRRAEPTLLQRGDRVHFEPITAERFQEIAATARDSAGTYAAEREPAEASRS